MLLLDRDLVDLGHRLSLFGADFERQPRDAGHDDGLAGADSLRTGRAPDLAMDAHSARRAALVERNAFGADERLRPDPRTPAPGAAHPEARLSELDRQADQDRDDPPARREDEQSERDGDD
jgi:hypothetical protein